MKKDFFKKLIFFIVSSCIFVSGCSFSGDDDNKALKAAIVMAANNSSSSEKVLVDLNFDTPRGGTMLPDQELTNLEFKGTRLEGGSFSTTADSKDGLCSKKIWLQTGTWDFTLSGFIDGVEFKGELKNFELTKTNASLSFNLTPDGISEGALQLDLNFSGDADYAVLKVTDTETNVTAESKTYRFDAETGSNVKKKIEYSKTFKGQNSDGLAPGTYLITVDFYRDGMKTGDLPLNTWKAYARIKAGLTAATEVDDYDLTDSYTITYHNVDNTALATSGVAIACFSRKSGTITLPVYTNAAGFNVLCWYETENFNISTPGITDFAAKNNLRNLDFYPLWDTDTAYAAAGGSGNGLTAANPAYSVEAALSSLKIIHGTAYGSTQNALTVQIDGVVEGNTVIGTDYDYAESLTLTGKTGNSTDSLKGSGSGCVLEVRTSKPVTVKNLKITGGSGVNYGGGIYICGNSSVILEDGALIEGNEANQQGGGIYVSRNTNTDAPGRTSLTINAGAKISGNKIKEDETYGNNGGMAIYVYGAKVEMNGGEISQNNGQTINQRGAVRLNEDAVLDLNDGKITDNTVMHIGGNIFCRKSTINMKGGEISEGKAGSSTQNGSGGGLWIEDNSSLNMTGGIICNNSVGPNGDSTGGAINIRNDEVKLTISGSAYIPSSGAAFDNDIYIQPLDNKSYQAVEIAGALTPPSDYVSAGKKIALTPGCWYRRAVILKRAAEAPSELIIEDYENYFTFTSSGVNYGYESDNTAIIVGPYYVADDGVDSENTSGDDQKPYKTLEYVVNMLSGGYDETIKVKGTLKGTQVIPSEFTTTNCKSLTIIGANGLDAQGNPKDVLTLADDAVSGSVLTINTQVPVTLKNIKITGGKGTPGLDNTDYTTGGGIHTGQNATLKLADGVLITGNTVTLSGGGIYLGNNSDLYMYGSSYVGDNQQRLAVHDSSTEDCANAAGYGGGIYNNGNVYLGYSGKDNSGNLIAADWIGGICRNCAGNGGGIDSSTGSTVKMRTGKISYNSAKYSKTGYVPYDQFGGGIYSYDTGAVEIIAGEISHNAAKSGGGIYIKDNNTVLKLTGGKMESNSADENGGAINYKDGKIEVSGNVYIPCTGEKQNDVYLAENKYITIAGNLSLPNGVSPTETNVTLAPATWKRGLQVLNGAVTDDIAAMFATTDPDFGVSKATATSGIIEADIVVATNNSSSYNAGTARGTYSDPYKTIHDAIVNAVDSDHTTITVKGMVTGAQIVTGMASGVDTVTVRGKDSTATIDAGSSGSAIEMRSDKNLIIQNLKLTGGSGTELKINNLQKKCGGGICITARGTVKLGDGVVITGNSVADNGGGVYVIKDANLFMYGKALIGDSATSMQCATATTGNQAKYGAGIYNDGGSVYIGCDTSGAASSEYALVANATDGYYGVRRNYSTASGAGAGIYHAGGTLKIASGDISQNNAGGANGPSCNGGGVYCAADVTISGGSFINNFASNGGGIYNDGTVIMTGGTISSNTAATGGAIYNANTLTLNGTLSIPAGTGAGANDIAVYYDSGAATPAMKMVSAGANLSATASSIAITPTSWIRGKQVLAGTASNFSCFKMSDSDWSIIQTSVSSTHAGKIDAPIYVCATGNETKGSSAATGYKTLEAAVAQCWLGPSDTNSTNGRIINISGTVNGAQTISSSIKTTTHATKITLQGTGTSPQLNGGFTSESKGTTLTVSSSVPVVIKSLSLTGGYASSGGGLYLASESNVTLGDGTAAGAVTITSNKAESNGAGIYAAGASGKKATLVINDKVEISSNSIAKASNSDLWGGIGIFAQYTDITMNGGTVKSHDGTTIATSSGNHPKGAGIYLNYASLNVKGGKITGNKTGELGANIYSIYSDVTIDGGEVSSGTLSSTANNGVVAGAGIFLSGAVTGGGGLLFKSGKITENTASSANGYARGAGIYTYLCPVTVENSGITNNTASGKYIEGGAVNLNGGSNVYATLELKGAASIPYGSAVGKNDVFLAQSSTVSYGTKTQYSAKVKVNGTLSESTTAATLQPQLYERGMLVAEGTSSQYSKLKLPTDFSSFKVDATTGKIVLANIVKDIYIKSTGADPSGDMTADITWKGCNASTEYKSFKTIKTAAQFITWQDSGTTDYTIYIDGSLTGLQRLTNEDSTSTAPINLIKSSAKTTAKSIKICGTSDSAQLFGNVGNTATANGVTLYIKTSKVPVTVSRLKINGGNNTGNGGGIYADLGGGSNDEEANKMLTLGDGTNPLKIYTNKAIKGGGVYCHDYTSLTIKDKVEIYANQALKDGDSTGMGGGIYVYSSNTYMTGGDIYDNIAEAYGGGIYSFGSTLFISGNACIGKRDVRGTYAATAASGNHSNIADYGGGIYAYGSFYLGYTGLDANGDPVAETDTSKTCMVNYNYAKSEGTNAYGGGGIASPAGKSYVSSRAKIMNNAAAKKGGGIYKGNTALVLEGGTIQYNKVSGGELSDGGAIYITGSKGEIQMKGNINIPRGCDGSSASQYCNDIYLYSGKKIYITGDLTQTTVAYISPFSNSNMVGKQIIASGDGFTGSLPSAVSKFKLSDASINSGKVIDGAGYYRSGTTATMSNVSDKISNVEEDDDMIVLTGIVTQADLATLRNYVKNSSKNIKLDLSQITASGLNISDGYNTSTHTRLDTGECFKDCNKLTEIVIDTSKTGLGHYAFENCTSLTTIVFVGSCSLGNTMLLYGCSELKTLDCTECGTVGLNGALNFWQTGQAPNIDTLKLGGRLTRLNLAHLDYITNDSFKMTYSGKAAEFNKTNGGKITTNQTNGTGTKVITCKCSDKDITYTQSGNSGSWSGF